MKQKVSLLTRKPGPRQSRPELLDRWPARRHHRGLRFLCSAVLSLVFLAFSSRVLLPLLLLARGWQLVCEHRTREGPFLVPPHLYFFSARKSFLTSAPTPRDFSGLRGQSHATHPNPRIPYLSQSLESDDHKMAHPPPLPA